MLLNKTISRNKVGILIIARSTSVRFNNKIESKILGFSLLEILIKRLLKKKIKEKHIILCTSLKDKNNKFFKKITNKYKIKRFYGADKNMFSRIIDCAKLYNFKHIVRLTGDNPFVDTKNLKDLILGYLQKKHDYGFMTGVPSGLKSELFKVEAIKFCQKNAIDPNSSEYLTYFFLRHIFKIFILKDISNINKFRKVSFTIDYKKDLNRLRRIIFENKNNLFLSKKELIKTSLKLGFFSEESKRNKTIPLKTKKYNVILKTDPKDMKNIYLEDFMII